jgi:hypothetical protein
MNQRTHTPTLVRKAAGALLALAAVCFLHALAQAQTTNGGTQINNQASASYSDGSNTYNVTSNTVTVTVANVSGLVITPDGGSVPNVVAGQTAVDFTFTVTNSGNYPTQVRFPALAGALSTSGPVTVTGVRLDVDGDGFDTVQDTDLLGNAAPVLYPASPGPYLARNASVNVVVRVSVNAGASTGAAISVTLGDAAADNEASEGTNTEVRTSVPTGTTAPVNGESEGVGTISTSVEDDARLRVTLAAPAGPIALGADINYTTQVCNVGSRTATAMTLGGSSGVWIVVPIPVGTALKSGQTFTGSVTTLYSTDALLTTSPAGPPPVTLQPAATWSAVAPGDLTTVRRVAFKVSDTLAGSSTCSASISYLVTVTTTNATQPIREMVDAFANNSVTSRITDQNDGQSTLAQIAGQGDGNALGLSPQPNAGISGTPILTPLAQVGDVLLGPSGAPAAVGPTDNNDDYTNKSVAPAAIAGLSYLDTLSGAATVDFVNTVQNTGNADDIYTFSAPTVPAGFTVTISVDGGTNFVAASSNPTLAVAFGASANIIVRVQTTANAAVLQGFATVIRAASANTPAETNDTINRLYTGFLRLEKTATVINNTSVGNNQSTPGADDPVPGADIEYVVTYTNVSVGGGGAGCVNLTASSVVINERGDVAPNNWGTTTTQVIAPMPVDANSTGTPGTVTDETTGLAVTAATVRLRDAVPNLGPGASGTFTFRRRIN